MLISIRLHALACCALLAAAPACGRDPAPTTAGALAGTYELRTVDGRAVPVDALGGVIGGRIVLTRDGRVTRVVQVATSGVPGPVELRSTGTYEVTGSKIRFHLVAERSVAATLPLQSEGELRGRHLVLRHGAPASGWVEETYVRTEG